MQDPDLRALRERREWLDLQEDLYGAVTRQSRKKFRAEAKAPFRLTRTALFGGISIGAGLGLLVITTRLIKVRCSCARVRRSAPHVVHLHAQDPSRCSILTALQLLVE